LAFHPDTPMAPVLQLGFYSASTLLAMQSAVIARGILSVCLSATFWCFVQKNKDMIVQFSASGRTSSFWRSQVYPDILRGSLPERALK